MKNVIYSLLAAASVGLFVGCSSGSSNSTPAQTCQTGMSWNGTQCVYSNGYNQYGYGTSQYGYGGGYGGQSSYIQQMCQSRGMGFYPPNYCYDGRNFYPVY